MVWVRERTIPTERLPLVGKVIANFCGLRVPRGQRDGSLRPYSRFSRQEPLLFYKVAPQLYSRGWVDPVPDPLLFFCSAGNRTRASGSVAKNSDHRTTEAVPLGSCFQKEKFLFNSVPELSIAPATAIPNRLSSCRSYPDSLTKWLFPENPLYM
jgi:hypothetical protein